MRYLKHLTTEAALPEADTRECDNQQAGQAVPLQTEPTSVSVGAVCKLCIWQLSRASMDTLAEQCTVRHQVATWKLLETGIGPWPKRYAASVLTFEMRSVRSTKRSARCTADLTAFWPACRRERLRCCISDWKMSSSDCTAARAVASCTRCTACLPL